MFFYRKNKHVLTVEFFCPFVHVQKCDSEYDFFLDLVENSPGSTQFYVDRRILYVRQNTLGVISLHVYIL